MVFRIFRKRLLSYFSAALGVFSVYSCTDQIVEDRIPNNPEGKLSAIIDNGLQTYASLGGNTGDASRAINWNTGDEVNFLAVVDSASVEDLGSIVAEDISGVNANFVVTPPISLTNYVAFYPAANFSSGIGSHNRQVNLSIPTQQAYVADGMPKNAYPMIAVGAVSPLKFKGVAGVLRFELTGEVGTTVNKVVFRSTGVKMSGASDWIDPLFYTAGSKLSFTTSNACDSVVLSCPSVSLSSTPVSFYIIVADTIYPASTTEISIEGSYGHKVYTASQAIVAESNRINARSLFYGDHDMQKEYDAHFIVGDSLESSTAFLNAAVTGGGNWLTLSENAAYKSSEQTQTYTGNSPLFIHLDENLTGSERSALIVATRSNGTVMKVLVKQQSAIYAGPFGNYGGASMGSPSEGSLDDSGQATPFSMQLRSGGKGYTKKMYVEAMPEYVSAGVPFASSSISSYSGSNKYWGLSSVKASYDKTKYSTYRSLLYQSSAYPAIDYCASKNRDVNGNGVLDEDEIKWYMPAINQAVGMWITGVFSNDAVYIWDMSIPYWTTTKALNVISMDYLSGTYSDAGIAGTETYAVRCVRDVEDVTHTVVFADVNSNSVINLSHLPSSVTTNITKGIAMGDEHSDVNKTLYSELRVAKSNCRQDGSAGYEEMSWSKAIGLAFSFDNNSAVNQMSASGSGCAEYYEESGASDRGTWRLPTQREMQAIWMWKDELENLTGFEAFSSTGNGYWTATETKASSAKAFVVNMASVSSNTVFKSGNYLVRCVKESASTSVIPYLQIPVDTIYFGMDVSDKFYSGIMASSSYAATSNQSWCKISKAEALPSFYNDFVIAVESNYTGVDRFARVTVKSGPLTKDIVVVQYAGPMKAMETYMTLEIEPLPFVHVSGNTRTLTNATTEESMMTDVAVYVYKYDGVSMYPEAMYYVPSVNATFATVTMKITSGRKKVFVAANTGGFTPIVYNNTGIGTESSIVLMKSVHTYLSSTSSGFEVAGSMDSGIEGGGDGLIKTMAGGAFGASNGLLNFTTSYTNNTRFFMSNWDGGNIGLTNAKEITATCHYELYPEISIAASQNLTIGTNNHHRIRLQRGIAKVSFRIAADKESNQEIYYSRRSDGSKGVFIPWTVNNEAVWALGGINKHMYPFQTFQSGEVVSPNYLIYDEINNSDAPSSNGWYSCYDNTRVYGTGKKYSLSSFTVQHVKDAMLSSGHYTFVSAANGSSNTYAFCTENAPDYPQTIGNSTFAMIGGEYRPENWISDVKRKADSVHLGWNGASANDYIENARNHPYSKPNWDDDEYMYYLPVEKVFIHGEENLKAYFALCLKYDLNSNGTGSPQTAEVLAAIRQYKDIGKLYRYNRGQCVYRIFIKDPSEQIAQNRSIVRRNFIYDIIWDRIDGPGEYYEDTTLNVCCGIY